MTRPEGAPSDDNWFDEAKAEISGLSDEADIAAFLVRRRSELVENASTLPGRRRTRMLSDLIDIVIRRMLRLACETAAEDEESLTRNLAAAERSLVLAATGGYGRAELAPYSDIDINFISATDDDPQVDAITRKMFRLIMDVFLAEVKLKVGYAYRLLGEAATLHHQNQTALLDARYVTGSKELLQSFKDELRRNIHPVAFYHDKVRERQSVIRRYGEGLYRVEPDIKEGEGSLRDFHLASWLAQVAFGFSSRTVWDDIKAHGLLSAHEIDRVYDAQEFFSRVRWEMHLIAGHQADTLTVPKQEAAAKTLGYSDSATETGVERLMRDYYRHAETAKRTAEKVIMRAEAQRLQLEPGLIAQGGQVVLGNHEVFLNDPVACIRAFAYCQRYGLKLGHDTIDALRECVASRPAPLDDQDASRLFLMILKSERVARTILDMAACGVLQWFIPEFGKVMGLVPFDAAHEYTVGWHSLQVVKHCERLGTTGDEDIRRIFASIRQPEVLYLLALLHDVGKQGASGDHALRGAEVAKSIADRLGLEEDASERLQFLVVNHILMSDTARLRDLNLRKTVDDFVVVVNDVDLLGMLFIFTNADILAVGSAAWSEIQGRFLRELYYRSERAIVTKAPLIDSEEDLALYRSRVRRELSLTTLPAEAVEEHVRLMPPMYLLNTGPEDMALHVEYIQKAIAGEPSIDFRSEQGSEFTEMTLCVQDDPAPGLLSKIAATLWAIDVGVHAAQVFTRENGAKIALDLLYVDFEGKQLPEFKKHQIQRELTQVLLGEAKAREVLQLKNKKLPTEFENLQVEVFNNLSEQHTVIDVVVDDQPGLLYALTKAFSKLGWDIHSARVSTWGNQAKDSFYVTDGDKKLDEGASEQLISVLSGGK